jgi:F-type H+-transporting ATPase subunit a
MGMSRFRRFIFRVAIMVISLLAAGSCAYPNEPVREAHDTASGYEKEFNAGEMIIEHIVDAHEWHIMNVGHRHISLPLPVILLDQGKLVVFSSARFHHGTESYKGYRIATNGKNKGRIVKVGEEVDETDTSAPLPIDLSVTKNVVALFISVLLLLAIFIPVSRAYSKRRNEAPSGIQSMLEPLIIFIRDDIARASIGDKKFEKYVPYLLTLFFFIFFSNLCGLIPFFPFGANLTGNIAVTGVMAVFTFILTSLSGNRSYWLHIFNTPGVPWWLKFPVPLMPIVEIMGIFIKPFVLMVRLFANMTAGHIIVLGFISLIFIFGKMHIALGYGVTVVSVTFAVFMGLLELLVAFIQAYVFTLLSALYFGMATEEHH